MDTAAAVELCVAAGFAREGSVAVARFAASFFTSGTSALLFFLVVVVAAVVVAVAVKDPKRTSSAAWSFTCVASTCCPRDAVEVADVDCSLLSAPSAGSLLSSSLERWESDVSPLQACPSTCLPATVSSSSSSFLPLPRQSLSSVGPVLSAVFFLVPQPG